MIDDMTKAVARENKQFAPDDLQAFLEQANHLDIAELFRDTVKDSAYFRFLRKRFRKDVPLSRLHRSIVKLPVKTFFTTNYDKLLEAAIRSVRAVEPTVVLFAEQLNYVGEDENRIVKLHGDIDHPSSIVLTRRDYAMYPARHEDFVRMLQASINGSTVLFVGFGLRDPNFRRIYSDARTLYDSTNRQAYAVMPGTNAVDRKFWHDEGLTILPATKRLQASTILDRLREA